MNILAALTLSTKRQAFQVIAHSGGIIKSLPAYVLIVSTFDPPDPEVSKMNYRLEILRVLYPEQAPGKGWGAPQLAQIPHFAEDHFDWSLSSYLEERRISTDDGWQPVEDDIKMVD